VLAKLSAIPWRAGPIKSHLATQFSINTEAGHRRRCDGKSGCGFRLRQDHY